MTTSPTLLTETDRLRALAKHYREQGEIHRVLARRGVHALAALADLFDGIADRHALHASVCGDPDCSASAYCDSCDGRWPCPDVRAALAVADAE